jgi:hypothetical protein
MLLGVTPQLAGLGGDLVAVDNSPKMLAQVWPGDAADRRAILADWTALPFAAGEFDAVIGLDERVRSRIEGENAYGEAKLRMIAAWVEKSGLTGKHGHVRFYSDHASDEPTFEWADEPVAVNPHARLARLAIRRGWAIEDWG